MRLSATERGHFMASAEALASRNQSSVWWRVIACAGLLGLLIFGHCRCGA